MSALSVSIIVPAYNAETYLPATLESLLAQSFVGWEAIIVDDGSTDDTLEVARRYARQYDQLRVITHQNEGVSAARNRGIAAISRGVEYVMFLDADDVLEDDALEILVGTLRSDPCAAGAHGMARYIDAQGQPIWTGRAEAHMRRRYDLAGWGLRTQPVTNRTSFAMLVLQCYVYTLGQAVVRRTALEGTGFFDAGLSSLGEDYEWLLRLTQRGDLLFTDRCVINYRQHSGNASRRLSELFAVVDAVRHRIMTSEGTTSKHRLIAYKAYPFTFYLESMLLLRSAIGSLLRGQCCLAVRDAVRGMKLALCMWKALGRLWLSRGSLRAD